MKNAAGYYSGPVAPSTADDEAPFKLVIHVQDSNLVAADSGQVDLPSDLAVVDEVRAAGNGTRSL